jgi:hypothetical protein
MVLSSKGRESAQVFHRQGPHGRAMVRLDSEEPTKTAVDPILTSSLTQRNPSTEKTFSFAWKSYLIAAT